MVPPLVMETPPSVEETFPETFRLCVSPSAAVIVTSFFASTPSGMSAAPTILTTSLAFSSSFVASFASTVMLTAPAWAGSAALISMPSSVLAAVWIVMAPLSFLTESVSPVNLKFKSVSSGLTYTKFLKSTVLLSS